MYPHVLHGNVVPGGWAMQGADTEEEVKVIAETRRVLDAPDLRMSVTTVRVPVAVGHSAAVWVELDTDADPDDVRALLRSAPGIVVVDDPAAQRYPMPRAVAGTDDVQVGRIRRDHRDARTGSRSSSAPTTCARVRRPMPCRSRSCCSVTAEALGMDRPKTPGVVL